MVPSKKPSGLRKEEPKRPLSDFQYLFRYLSTSPHYEHEGWCFALKSADGNLTFIHNEEHRPPYFVAHMRDLARFLNMELVTVKGRWVWEATTTEIETEEVTTLESNPERSEQNGDS